MKTIIYEDDFISAFQTWQGGQYKNNFSIEGLHNLFEYLEEYEEDTGEEINFDMVAIACDYSEYEDKEEFIKEYKLSEIQSFEEWKEENDPEDEDAEEEYEKYLEEELEAYLYDNTILIKFGETLDDGFIIQSF